MTKRKKHDQGRVWVREHTNWSEGVAGLCHAAGLARRLRGKRRVVLKPNLVEAVPPPVTTPVGLVWALVDYLEAAAPHCAVIVAEGCGARGYDTAHCFRELGYAELAAQKGVTLLDLNGAPLKRLVNPECRRWPEIHLPALLFDSFLVSLPVLKAHSLAGVTLTMKNMMGAAPPAHYQQGGHWKKAAFHRAMQEAVFDLNRYRTPDFTLLDATIGMRVAHLWGPTCEPPPNRLVAAYDPVAVDAYGTALLARDWRQVGHIRLAHGVLGCADPLDVVEVA
ncbi:MAG: DUF362 domain-containing protein [Thermodesulfobacteriota bacterium]